MGKKDKNNIYIPLWRDRCLMLNDSRLADEQVGKIIRAAIRYDLDGTTPEPMGEVGLDILCSVLISDINVSREAREKLSKKRSDAAKGIAQNKVQIPPNDNDIELVASGYFSE